MDAPHRCCGVWGDVCQRRRPTCSLSSCLFVSFSKFICTIKHVIKIILICHCFSQTIKNIFKNNRYLYLELFNGNSYEEVDPRDPKKRVNLPFARSSFKKQKIRFDMASFQLERSDEERYSNAAQFMNLSQLNETSDSLKKSIKTRLETYQSKLQSYYKFATVDSLSKDSIVAFEKNLKNLSRYKKNRLHKAAANMVRSSKSYVYNTQRELKFKKKIYSLLLAAISRKYETNTLFLIHFCNKPAHQHNLTDVGSAQK